MSTSAALYTSASLAAQNAPAFHTLQKLDPALLKALQSLNYEFMTPVQEEVLNKLPDFSSDCLVQAKTGTGKTTAFLLPAIQNTLRNPPSNGQVSVLILSPTRELALQIAAEAQRLVSKMQKPLQIHTAFGGTAKASSLSNFKHGDPKVIVATPGRLKDYLSEADVRSRFESMKTLVLDEADRMLDAGFLPDILKILSALPPKNGPGRQWQGMAFSATIPQPMVETVFKHILSKDYTRISTVDASEPPTIAIVPQYSVIIPGVVETFTALHSLLVHEIDTAAKEAKIIVFGTTANLVSLYAKIFTNRKLWSPVMLFHLHHINRAIRLHFWVREREHIIPKEESQEEIRLSFVFKFTT